jgi:hypothetical protein
VFAEGQVSTLANAVHNDVWKLVILTETKSAGIFPDNYVRYKIKIVIPSPFFIATVL